MLHSTLLPVPGHVNHHPKPLNADYTISHAPYLGSTVADGTSGPPQYGTPVTRNVFGWYPQSSEVPVGNDDVSDRVKTSLIVLVPDSSVYKAGDKVTIESAVFRVSEDVRDWTKGPFGYQPGGQIVVEKVSG